MKAATTARIHRRGARLQLAIANLDSALLHDKAIGPYLAALAEALTTLTFSWMLEARRDDLAMTLVGCPSRLQTQAQCEQLLSLLHRIPGWKELGTFSHGSRARLHDMERALLDQLDIFKRPPSNTGGSFDFPDDVYDGHHARRA